MLHCQKWQLATRLDARGICSRPRRFSAAFSEASAQKKKRPGAQKTLNEGNGHLGARPQSVAPEAYEMPVSAANGGIPAGISNVRLIELHFIPDH
ncbi:protein of unknown function [Hyphomicrobium sp. 1Nfss2.1]